MRTRNYPQLIVFNEKHGDNYFLVESKEAEEKMYLDVLTNRNKYGFYSWMKDYKPYRHPNDPVPTYTKEDILSMPDSMEAEKKRLMNEYLRYEKSEKEATKIRQNWIQIQEAIEKKDGKLAYELISDFSDGEYEGYENISFTHIK